MHLARVVSTSHISFFIFRSVVIPPKKGMDTYYMYHRCVVDGVKTDKYTLSIVTIEKVKWGPFRYSNVSVSGYEDDVQPVDPKRIFVLVDDPQKYATWKSENFQSRNNTDGFFDDDRSLGKLRGKRALFDQCHHQTIDNLIPAFGFKDRGNVIARSAQPIVLNPFISEIAQYPVANEEEHEK